MGVHWVMTRSNVRYDPLLDNNTDSHRTIQPPQSMWSSSTWLSRIIQNVPRAKYTVLIKAFLFQNTCRQIHVLKVPSQLGFYFLLYIATSRHNSTTTTGCVTIHTAYRHATQHIHFYQYFTCIMGERCGTVINRLTPNDPYMCRTAPLTSKRCILYIYSTNIGTEYFK